VTNDIDLLPRSPLLIFLLVAASDGKVDRKELTNFQKVVLGSGRLPSPLLQKAIAEMLPNLERYLQELTSGKFDYIGELKRIGDYVDQNHPAEAETFKMSLLGLGKLIAESSGGFFGFGNKMSKDEEKALVAIAVTLGVYPKP
jgi:tellurite resistance protein